MERDQHSSGEQTPGEQTQGEGAGRAAEPGPPAAGPQPDAIMSKLPRTRPQRVTGRRQRNPCLLYTSDAADE